MIREAFLQGVSTRPVGRLIALLAEEPVSAQTVSRLSRALEQAIAAWIAWYNTRYRHSTLGYRTPAEFEQLYHLSHSTQFVAA